MSVLLSIKDWNEHFEVNRTRELKVLHWIPVPNKHDGDGYTALLDHPDGTTHLGAWVAILQVASKCAPRGTLLRDNGKPHDPATISRMTHVPAAHIEAAIKRLVSDDIGWLEVVDMVEGMPLPQKRAPESQEPASPIQNGMEWKEEKEGKGSPVVHSLWITAKSVWKNRPPFSEKGFKERVRTCLALGADTAKMEKDIYDVFKDKQQNAAPWHFFKQSGSDDLDEEWVKANFCPACSQGFSGDNVDSCKHCGWVRGKE